MPDAAPPAPKPRSGRWLRRLSAVALAAVVVLAVTLASLPTLLSTDPARRLLERIASDAVRCPVRVERLHWRWREALVLEGVRLADEPRFSLQPLAALRRAELRVRWRELLGRRLAFDLSADGLSTGYVRTADGATNWGVFLANLPPSKPKPPRKGPLRLPLDVTARVRLTGIDLTADDRRTGRQAAVRRGAIAVDVPSLRSAPAIASVAAAVEADGRSLAPVSLTARAAGLFDRDGVVQPLAAAAEATADLPGVRLDLRADLPRKGATSRLVLDLARFVEAFGPFLPSAASPSEAGGSLSLTVDAIGDPKGPVSFRILLAGEGVRASGGVLGAAAAGPLRLGVEARGTGEPARGRWSVTLGEVHLQERTRLDWTAGFADGAVAAEIAPAALDLGELVALARPFRKDVRNLALEEATLDAVSLRWSRPAAGAPSPVSARGLSLRIASLRDRSKGRALVGGGLRLDVPTLDAALDGGFPSRADLAVSLRVAALRGSGPDAFSLEGLDVPTLRVAARELARRKDGAFGLTGRVSLRESVSLARFSQDPIRSLRGLRHSLTAEVALRPGRAVDVVVGSLTAAVRSAAARDGGGTVGIGGGGDGAAAELRLAGARFSGPLRGGRNPVRVERVDVTLPAVAGVRGPSRFSARGLRLALRDAAVGLVDRFPESAGLTASLVLGSARVEGPRRLRVESLSVPSLRLAASALRRSPGTPFGLSGRLAVRQALELGSGSVAGAGAAQAVRQELDADAELGPAPQVRVRRLRLDAEEVVVEDPGAGRSRLPLRLDASAERVVLRSVAPLRADAQGAQVRLAAGPLLTLNLAASASDLGRGALETAGRLDADLSRLPARLAELARHGLRLGGRVGLTWDVAGRLPTEGETTALAAARGSPGPLPLPLAFAGRVDVAAVLSGASIHLPLEGGRSLSLAGVSTPRPLRLTVGRRGERARLDGAVLAEVVEEVPGLAPFDLPPRASLDLTAEQEGQQGVKLSETLAVDLLGLRQTLVADVAGVDRAFRQGLVRPSALWLRALDGTVRATFDAGRGVGAVRLGRDLSWNGPLVASAQLRLRRGEDVEARVKLDSAGLDARVGELVAVRRLRSHLDLTKRYALASRARPADESRPLLSRAVLEPPRALTPGADDRNLRFMADDLGRQFRGAPSVAFDRLSVRWGGRTVELERGEVDLRLDGGLPVIDRLRLDLLGGSLLGSAGLGPEGQGFPLRGRLAFSGLDPGRLAPGLAAETAGEGTVSAQAAFAAPLARGAQALLSDLDLRLDVTRVGRRALDRLLYSLDPTGGNEAVAKQRRLVQTGTPRWVSVGVRRGNLSLAGEVEVKGVRLAIPPVDRLNVSDLPVRDRLEHTLARLGPAVEALRTLGASTIEVGPKGEVSFAGPRTAARPATPSAD